MPFAVIPDGGSGAFTIDFSGLGKVIVDGFVEGITHLLSPLPTDFDKWMIEQLQGILSAQSTHNLLTHVPPELTSGSGDMLELFRQGVAVEFGLAALVLVIQGFRVVSHKVDLFDAIFRVGFFVIVGEGMIIWSDLIFRVINAASDAVGSAPMDIRAETLPNDFVLASELLIALVFAAFAWLKGAVGVLFLKVLIVSAPYLLTLSALPLMDGLGKWWAEEFTTWTLRAFMVALVLRLGLGIAVTFGGPLQFLFAIVAFWLAYTMDTRMRRFSVGAWGSIGQLGLLTRGARLAAGVIGGGAAAPAAAAASATP
jgi:hypothetical protein